MSDPTSNARPGRPRDEQAGPAILAATRQLLDRHGYHDVTTALIARQAGVGKQTLYRRWDSKPALILDALADHARRDIDWSAPPLADDDLEGFLVRVFAAVGRTGDTLRHLMAEAQSDVAFRSLLKERLIEPRRAALRAVLERRIGADPATLTAAVAAIYGALWYRLMMDEPLDAAFAGDLARLVPGRLSAASAAP